MSQDSREKFGVKSQMRGRGGGGGEERKDMLKAEQSRGSMVCVNGLIYKAMWFLIKRFPWSGQNDTTHIEAAERRGQGAMVNRPLPSPMDLKSDCIKEIACHISIFCK